VIAHVLRLEHLIDQHEATDDVTNRSLLLGADDASMAQSLSMKTQEMSILCEDHTPTSGGPGRKFFISRCEQARFLSRHSIDASCPQRAVTAVGTCSSI